MSFAEPATPARTGHGRGAILLAVVAMATAILGIAALWTTINLMTQSLNAWAALVAALDAALLLRLAGIRGGALRIAFAEATTVATTLLAAFLTATTRVGMLFGVEPFEAAQRTGWRMAWTVISARVDAVDCALLAAALVVAWLASR